MNDEYIRKNCPDFQRLIHDVADIKTGLLGNEYGFGGIKQKLISLQDVEIPRLDLKIKDQDQEINQLKSFKQKIVWYTAGAAFGGGAIMHLIISVIKYSEFLQ